MGNYKNSLLWRHGLVSPNPARVILGSCNYGVTLVIEGAREDFVFVAVQHLHLVPSISVPHSASLVTARCDDLIALWVELYLGYLIFVTLQQCCARSCEYIIDSSQAISRGSSQLVSSAVESSV